MLLAHLLACGSQAPTLATEPDARATEAVINALCDLAKAGKHTCTPRTRQAAIDDKVLTVEVFVDNVEDTLGQVAVAGRARLSANGQQLVSRFDLVGWGEDEAYKRGVHLWAVLTGAPLVDWFLADASRPSLSALYRANPAWAPSSAPVVGPFRALEGWTFLQGVHTEVDHGAVVATLEGVAGSLSASAPHTVEIWIAADLGEQVFVCQVDGVPSLPVCEAIKAAPWPSGVGWELRQTYVLVPQSAFPALVGEGSTEGTDGTAPAGE